MPYLGDAGFYTYAQLLQLEADPAHDVNPYVEVPFVPQSMLDDEFQSELPPPPARGPRHIQGDIRLPANVREDMLPEGRIQPELERALGDQSDSHYSGRSGDITPTQPVEGHSPIMVEERTPVPQIGGGVHDIPQSEARSSIQPAEISLPGEPFQREFTPEEDEMPQLETVDDTMGWFQQEEPVRRRPPRQLRSRTTGQIRWDSEVGCRTYDVEEGILQEEIQQSLSGESLNSWYGPEERKGWSDHVRYLLYDPRPIGEEAVYLDTKDEFVSSEDLVIAGNIQETETVPPIISLEGPSVEPQTRSFAVLSQYLIDKMDKLERQFQRWYASLMLGLGTHLEQVNSSIEAIYQMGLTKRGAKKDGYHARQMLNPTPVKAREHVHQDGKITTGLEMNPWTAWISQIKLNEQEVPEFFRTSDAMKQTVEILEDEEVLQTTTCTPKDIDKDPEGWKVAFKTELDSFDRLEVMILFH